MSRQVRDYLVCYDIADPKRLSKLARALEKRAYRIQYSIFLLKEVANHEISFLGATCRFPQTTHNLS